MKVVTLLVVSSLAVAMLLCYGALKTAEQIAKAQMHNAELAQP